MCALSIVIPVYNEEENVRPLFEKIQAASQQLNVSYEIPFVDDGIQDSTLKVISELHKDNLQLKVIGFEKDAGQTAAIAAGFEFAKGNGLSVSTARCKMIPPIFLNSLKNPMKATI